MNPAGVRLTARSPHAYKHSGEGNTPAEVLKSDTSERQPSGLRGAAKAARYGALMAPLRDFRVALETLALSTPAEVIWVDPRG